MATVRTMCCTAKLVNFQNTLLPIGLRLSPKYLNQTVTQTNIPVRWGSYSRGPKMDSREVQTEVEVVNDPEAWAIVERLIAQPTIPFPKPKAEYPSGWKPPKLDKNLPYYVGRTANHMHSVKMDFSRRTTRRMTVLRKIQGDIWALDEDLRQFLVKLEDNPYIATSVNEAFGKIYIQGDHENNVKLWLEKQGF